MRTNRVYSRKTTMIMEGMVNIHIVQRIKGPRPPNCDMFLFLVVQLNVRNEGQQKNEA